jgi:hypothetical protein
MRVSPGDLRSGLTDAAFVIPTQRPTIVSTYSVTTKAVRVFHTEGSIAAEEYLTQAFAGSAWRSGANATKARVARNSFANYRRRAAADPRPAALGDPRASIQVAGHTVGAGCDVVTLDPGGHTGRLCIWSIIPRALTQDELSLLACPVVIALGNELGDETISGLEIWMLRTDEVARVDAGEALAQLTVLNTLVRRLTQS